MKNPKFSLGIRIVAGCYLIYLAYHIACDKDGLIRGSLHGWQFAVALLGVIVFIGVGVVIAYQASKTLMEMHREEKLKAAEEAAEEAIDEVMQQQSSSERFRNMKSLADLEVGALSEGAADAAVDSEANAAAESPEDAAEAAGAVAEAAEAVTETAGTAEAAADAEDA